MNNLPVTTSTLQVSVFPRITGSGRMLANGFDWQNNPVRGMYEFVQAIKYLKPLGSFSFSALVKSF